jgi:MarR family transcriptional repressor of mepA
LLDRTSGVVCDLYIRNIARTVNYKQDEELKPYGITNQQASLLGAIHRFLELEKDIARKDLEMIMNLKGPSITSLLNGLDKKGFISRTAGAEDGRTMQLRMTEKGAALIERLQQIFRDSQHQLLLGMTVEEMEMFQKLLKQAYANVSNGKPLQR